MKQLTKCVVCRSSHLAEVLNLGCHPLANTLLPNASQTVPRVPLIVNRCEDCGHCQLTVAVEPDEMFRDYRYVSGTSQTMRDHFDQFAADATAELGPSLRVLDLASNDGTLLDAFARRGHVIHGVDPAENLAKICQSKLIPVTAKYWTAEVAKTLGHFNLITAFNVLAHTADPLAFLQACALSLDVGGRIVVQTGNCDWLEMRQFDCVYHEHVSYFTESSIRRLAMRCGLQVERIERVSLHGTSLRVTLVAPFQTLKLAAQRTCRQLQKTVSDLRRDGWTVCGFGAAAKGNTLLESADCFLDWIADENPLKIGRFTPFQKIPIRDADSVSRPDRLAVVLLAWNLADEIKAKVLARRSGKSTRFVNLAAGVQIEL